MPTTLECVTPKDQQFVLQVIVIHRLKQDAAATTPISAFCIGFVNEKQHTAADWTRFLNFHFYLLKDSGSIFKFNKHFLTLLKISSDLV